MRQAVLSGEGSTTELLAGSLRTGGKRIRPVLALLSTEACGRPALDGVDVAAVAELIHTASLLHDDVVDHAATRRGNPTLHSMWGNKLAVLGGDYILAQSLRLLLTAGDLRLLDTLAATVAAMGEGEILQIFHLFDVDTDEQDYFERIRRKTADLMACACEMGALVAGAPEEHVTRLRVYGMAIGMAFQVVDDLLDCAGDQATVGKPVGSDLREGNLTLPVIHALRGRDGEAIREAIDRRALTPEKAEHLAELVRRNGSVEYAYQAAERFVAEGRSALAGLPPSPAVAWLDSLAAYLLSRES
jgi:geranylgeranyl pyrophosphate synthase